VFFFYIPITERDENYEKNIEEMKRYKIWELFSDDTKKNEMFEAFLEQINKITELRHIFELFPEDEINKDFCRLIRGKIKEISNNITNEKPENYQSIFEIFKTYLICLEKNGVTLYIPEINYDFNFKLFQYILQENSLKKVVNKLEKAIISFFLETNIFRNGIEEDIVTILLLSSEKSLCTEMLDNMTGLVIKKKDFYSKEETRNYNLFKLIFQNYEEIVKKNKKGKYIKETLKMKEEIYNELYRLEIVYETINNIFDEENTFYPRLLLICDKEEETIELNNKVRVALQACREKLSIFEKIEEFYNTFLSETKKEIIAILRTTIFELRKKKLEELLQLKENKIIKDDNDNIDNNFFNYDESVKESQNIKYKYSQFFMAIYKFINMNENFRKSEREIFNESINAYRNTITKIITQKESKIPFFEIEHINEIMKVIGNTSNNLQNEIDFIKEEFKNLRKDEYITNNLLEDLINFSNKVKIGRLLDGIIYFIKTYQKIVKISLTGFTKNYENNLINLNKKNITRQEIQEINKFLF